MREIDPRADGEVGDVDPMLAIEDALRETKYDSIVLAMRSGLTDVGPTWRHVRVKRSAFRSSTSSEFFRCSPVVRR